MCAPMTLFRKPWGERITCSWDFGDKVSCSCKKQEVSGSEHWILWCPGSPHT